MTAANIQSNYLRPTPPPAPGANGAGIWHVDVMVGQQIDGNSTIAQMARLQVADPNHLPS